MLKMTFDEFDNLLDEYHKLPPPPINYGLTKEDIEKLNNNVEKYALFAAYLETLPVYEKYIEKHTFINQDALGQKEAATLIDDIVNKGITLTEE